MKDIIKMSQFEYERLLSAIAGVLRTQRRLVTIESEKRISPHIVHYEVKRRGSFYKSLVSAMDIGDKFEVINWGFII